MVLATSLFFLAWAFRLWPCGGKGLISSYEGLKCRKGLSHTCRALTRYDDKREKCDEEKFDCGRVHGLVGDTERFGKNCGDWSQLSLVGSRGSTQRIENPRPSGCGETPEFEGTSKKIRVESGPRRGFLTRAASRKQFSA